MRLIKSSDFYSVKLRGYVTSLHLDVLDVLYQPILGFAATSIYRFLYVTRELRNEGPNPISIISTHLGFTFDQLTGSLNRLEALGLVRSYVKSRQEYNEYTFELLAPKDPAMFSNDQIFLNLLIQVVGPRLTQDLLGLFKLDRETFEAVEVSADFASIYGPQVESIQNHDIYQGTRLESIVGGVKIPFDDALFFNFLTKERKILPTSISEQEFNQLKQIAGLYDLSEDGLAQKVGDYYDTTKPFGKRIDIPVLQSDLKEIMKYPTISKPIRRKRTDKLTSDSEKVKLINKMEILSPFDFLLLLNDGTAIAPADEKILEELSYNYNLVPPVINALVYYTLLHNNNELIKALMLKNGSKLARNRVYTAIDALDALEKAPGWKKKQVKVQESNQDTAKENIDYDALWDELKKVK